MRVRRLYFPALGDSPRYYTLLNSETQFHYLANVLRVKKGQLVELFDGQGIVGNGSVIDVAKKSIEIEISEINQFSAPKLKLHLVLGISKGDRMDYALQKSTELGVTHITPIWTERGDVKLKTERLQKKIAHWQGVITSACEQSYQNFVPELLEPQQLIDVPVCVTDQDLALVCDISGKPFRSFVDVQPKSVTFFVGSEGGWTLEEINFLSEKNVQALQLGPRILRTETAPIAMLSLAQYVWGDFI